MIPETDAEQHVPRVTYLAFEDLPWKTLHTHTPIVRLATLGGRGDAEVDLGSADGECAM